MVQLTDELVAELDSEATRTNVSRSALIRQAIDELLASRRSSDAVDRYVQGYKSNPQATPDQWGDLATSGDQQNHDLAMRLDAEEEAAGLQW